MGTNEQAGKGNGGQGQGGAAGGNGLAILSLVFGVAAVVLAVLLLQSEEYTAPGMVVACGLIGVVAAILYIGRNKRSGAVAGAGLWLSVVGMFLAVIASATRGVDTNIMNWVGKEAPDFTVVDLEGKKVQLSEMRGRRVLLDFWATWCPPCRIEVPFFVELRKSISEDDLAMVAISEEDAAEVRGFGKEFGVNYQLVASEWSALPIPYSHVEEMPTTVFIDRKGIVQSVLVGAHDLATLRSHAVGPDYEAK